MKTCTQVQECISAYLDRELAGAEAMEVGRHLEQCARCRADMRALLSVKEVLRGHPVPSMPAHLAAVIRERTVSALGWRFPSFRWVWAPALVGLAAAAGTWYLSRLRPLAPSAAPIEVVRMPMVVASTPSVKPDAVACRLDDAILVRDLH